MSPKYPHIDVPLSETDGNAFAIIGTCRKLARQGGVPDDEIEAFTTEAKSGDYDHLLQTCMKWFDVS